MADDKSEANVTADIYVLLPGRDCGEDSPCGLPKCVLFAKALVAGRKKVHECPYLEEEKQQQIILLLEDYFR